MGANMDSDTLQRAEGQESREETNWIVVEPAWVPAGGSLVFLRVVNWFVRRAEAVAWAREAGGAFVLESTWVGPDQDKKGAG